MRKLFIGISSIHQIFAHLRLIWVQKKVEKIYRRSFRTMIFPVEYYLNFILFCQQFSSLFNKTLTIERILKILLDS